MPSQTASALPLFSNAEAAMPEYQLFFLTSESEIVHQVDYAFEDDRTALAEAHERARDHTIDVWQNDRRVALVAAKYVPLTFNDAPTL
jgi:hypothetical protein